MTQFDLPVTPGPGRGWTRRRALGVAAALALAGCAPSGGGGGGGSGRKRILTTFTILADMARNVVGEAAEVASITKPGAEIHGYEPTPKDIVKAQEADLVLWNGLNLEVWFEKFFEDVRDVPRAVLTEGIEPMSIVEGPYLGKPNPHAWMSPANGVRYVENIRKALIKADAAHEAVYSANAAAYAARIQALDAPVREKLAGLPAAQRWLVTSEGAFSYLCRNYDLRELYLWPINADAQGTPQQVQHVIDTVREHRIPVVFSESTVSDKPARQVARETGAKYGGVLYVDSLTEAGGPAPTYLKLLEYNADVLVAALRGHDTMEAARTDELRLEVDGVSVTYPNGTTALRDATFSLTGGTICALVGVNGSGKSTLFKSIMGFVKPVAGDVRIAGRPVAESLRRHWVAYVPQAEEVDWQFPVSVWDVVVMGRYAHMNFLRRPRPDDRAAVEASLRRVEMWDYRDRQIGELSGGQRKRVFLARALAQGGRLLLLDEPFTGVDVKTEEAIIRLLGELRDEGCIVLVSTHNLGSVPEFCDQVVLVNRTVLAFGSTTDVFTEQNLTRAFGGVLRQFHFEKSTIQDHDGRTVKVLTDDERPLVFGRDGHLEYKDREGREDLVREREREETGEGKPKADNGY